MNADDRFETQLGDPGTRWARALRREVVDDLPPEQVHDLAVVVAGLAAASASATAAAVGAAAATQGGTAMTAPIAASAATQGVAKIVGACALAAGLTVGGSAALTGNLPDGAQEFAADAGAVLGLDLPRADVGAGTDVTATAQAFDIVAIDTVGHIEVGLDEESHLVLGDISTEAGVTADVVLQADELVVVDFVSSQQTLSVELTAQHGAIDAEVVVRTDVDGSAGINGAADVESGAVLEVDLDDALGIDVDTDVSIGGNNANDTGATGEATPCGGCDEGSGGTSAEADAAVGVTLNVGISAGSAIDGPEGTPCRCDPNSDNGSETSDDGSVSIDAGTGIGVGIGISLGG